MKTELVTDNRITAKKAVLYYSLLFFGTAASIFIILILTQKSVIQYSDGYKQGYFWVVEVKQQLEDLISGNGFNMWSWNKGLGMNTSVGHLIDPFMVIAALFPAGFIELGYSIATILKMYCGGLVFLAFLRQVNMPDFRGIFGALCYIFSAWFIEVALCQSAFLMNAYLFPLLVIGVERIYRGKSPIFFIAVVAYYMVRNFYFSYMAAIVIIIYLVIRYFAYNDRFDKKEFTIQIGKFVIYGIVGCLISSLTMLTSINDLSTSLTASATDKESLLFNLNYYLGFGERFLGRGMTDDYMDIGLPIIILLLLPVAVRKISRKSTNTIMSLVLVGMMFIPFFCSMFNGFGYCTLRWSFTFIFFAVWAAMDVLDFEELRKKSNLCIMGVALVSIGLWTILPALMGIVEFGPTALVVVPCNIFAGAVILTCFAIKREKLRQNLVVFFTLGALIVGWNWAMLNHAKDFLDYGQINAQLQLSPQRVGSQIDDNGFYRVDQIDHLRKQSKERTEKAGKSKMETEDIDTVTQMRYPANENVYWNTKSIYIYNSKLPGKLLDFNKYMGNNYGYLTRVYILSNDNRMGLDFLSGVKYYLGDDNKNKIIGADEYAGYGFEYYDTIDGVDVYKNKYDPGIGFAYDKIIRESQFLKLSRLEREEAILQAAVIPDDEIDSLKVGEIKAEDIETGIDDVPYTITATDGISIEDNKIIVSKEAAHLDIQLNNSVTGQLIVSFDNLHRLGSNDMEVRCSNDELYQMVLNDSSNQTIPGISDFDMNMGYYDSYSGMLRISIRDPGEYTYDKLYVSVMSTDVYDKYASERVCDKLKVKKYNEEKVEGIIKLKKRGVVYFSIPAYSNWKFYVDGEPTDKIKDVNIAFVGIEVPAGSHEITLQYESKYQSAGLTASILGIVMFVIIAIVFERQRRPTMKSQDKFQKKLE